MQNPHKVNGVQEAVSSSVLQAVLCAQFLWVKFPVIDRVQQHINDHLSINLAIIITVVFHGAWTAKSYTEHTNSRQESKASAVYSKFAASL